MALPTTAPTLHASGVHAMSTMPAAPAHAASGGGGGGRADAEHAPTAAPPSLRQWGSDAAYEHGHAGGAMYGDKAAAQHYTWFDRWVHSARQGLEGVLFVVRTGCPRRSFTPCQHNCVHLWRYATWSRMYLTPCRRLPVPHADGKGHVEPHKMEHFWNGLRLLPVDGVSAVQRQILPMVRMRCCKERRTSRPSYVVQLQSPCKRFAARSFAGVHTRTLT